jgi:cytochrome c oxidase subunit 2
MIPSTIAVRGANYLSQVVPKGTRSNVFEEIYTVFLVLGTLVGIVVIAYMLQKAYAYRASARSTPDDDAPELGEVPQGGGGGRKLFVSFTLSAIIVVSLITWTYFTLLYVENPEPETTGEPLEVEVVGHQFYWEFVYPNGHSTQGTLRVPEDRRVKLTVTSADVFHNFGVPELRAKADAIPGERTTTWFIAEQPGTYRANCYELCGTGHSYMSSDVRVMEQDSFQNWYADTANNSTSGTATTNETTTTTSANAALAGVATGGA